MEFSFMIYSNDIISMDLIKFIDMIDSFKIILGEELGSYFNWCIHTYELP